MMKPRKLAYPPILGIQPYSPGKPIEELEREYGISGSVKLASNENPLGAGPAAKAALLRHLDRIAYYPDSHGYYLKRQLADYLGVSPDWVTLGNGSNEILELVARAFVLPGEQVIFSQYAFIVYPIVTQAVGGEAVVTDAREWGADLNRMKQAVTDRTKLVYLANPNNPTGTWTNQTDLTDFLAAVPSRVLVVVDEAYAEYVLEPEYPQCITLLEKFPNLIVTRTFSKIYGLAGLRVGYAVAHPDITELLHRVREPFNVNGLGLAAAEAALGDVHHVERSRTLNREGMDQLVTGLARLGLSVIPSAGNFVTIDFHRPVTPLYEGLLRQGVITRPIGNYNMPNHLRVTVGLLGENRRFLQALDQVLGEQASG